jgi:hypothetical protein
MLVRGCHGHEAIRLALRSRGLPAHTLNMYIASGVPLPLEVRHEFLDCALLGAFIN